MSELRVAGLTKSFGHSTVLHDLNLTVAAGTLAAVLGPSGCGKTTLLRAIAGFERIDSGTIHLAEQQLAGPKIHLNPERRKVGVVPQDGSLFPHLDVHDNVGFGLPKRSRNRRETVGEMLELVGLSDFGHRRPQELSGGQQQRVALARALAPKPDVVLLDEPFSALDASLRATVREDVRTVLREVGATAVLVTHDQEEALSVADTVAVLRAGTIVQHATPQQIYSTPTTVDVATFVGESVVFPAVADGPDALTGLGALPVLGHPPAGARGCVVVRPEQLRLVANGEGHPARVTRTVFHGHDATVHLEVKTDDGSILPVICRVQGPTDASGEVGVAIVGPVLFYS